MTRVLIVDDNRDNLYLLRALLQGHGYGVEEARHGAEALNGGSCLHLGYRTGVHAQRAPPARHRGRRPNTAPPACSP